MTKSLIKHYSSSLIKGFVEKAISLNSIEHNLTKGELRELLVTELLSNWLTNQFSIGSGLIVDINGNQSKQTDIIIYDNTILPPFIKQLGLGVYPIECVLATIEVKTKLTKSELIKSDSNAKFLFETVKFHKDFGNAFVLQTIIGIFGNPISEIRTSDDSWISSKINGLRAICHVSQYSWLKYPLKNNWHFRNDNLDRNEETKRFFAWLLDTIRNKSKKRHDILASKSISLMSEYMRE